MILHVAISAVLASPLLLESPEVAAAACGAAAHLCFRNPAAQAALIRDKGSEAVVAVLNSPLSLKHVEVATR